VMWEGHGYIWYGYEVEGLENIPDSGPALLVYYHGAIPIDYYYLSARCIIAKKRLIYSVGDRFLFMIPGWTRLMEVLKVFPGSVSTCVKVLNEGNLLAISPGGVREAQFGTEYYELVWSGRVGFAKVAKQAQVPIIPIFTQNIREAFRTVQLGQGFFRWLYDKYRLPLAAIYGGFPVKLTTYIGKPIMVDPDWTPEEISLKASSAIEELIQQHQIIPGQIIRAMVQRVYTFPKKSE
ncbi:PREDICTED: transmembrane protein 68-like, partial [Rhagoletis zephyria]|uniref:transmembrane protein 68-like n=1 Tax=Rhagoletis zephyria TaxID=28612 RepID=UPI000811A29A